MSETKISKKIKEGYVVIYVQGIDSFIVNSSGFNFYMLQEINRQIQEKEQFEGVESDLYVFKPKFVEGEYDGMGRETCPQYWLLEEDEYCEKKTKELRKEMLKVDKEG